MSTAADAAERQRWTVDELRRRRRRARLAMIPLGAGSVAAAVACRGTRLAVAGLPDRLLLVAGLAAAVAALVYSRAIWRCPACGGRLPVGAIGAAMCRRCGALFVDRPAPRAAMPADAQTLKEQALAAELAKCRGWYTLFLVNGMGMLAIGVVMALWLPPASLDPRQPLPPGTWFAHAFGDAGPGILVHSLSGAALLFGIGITAYAARCLTVRLRHQEYRLRRLLRLGPPQPGRTAAR